MASSWQARAFSCMSAEDPRTASADASVALVFAADLVFSADVRGAVKQTRSSADRRGRIGIMVAGIGGSGVPGRAAGAAAHAVRLGIIHEGFCRRVELHLASKPPG